MIRWPLLLLVLLSGCATVAVKERADGYDPETGFTIGEPSQAWKALYLVSIPFDIITSPVQAAYFAFQLSKFGVR